MNGYKNISRDDFMAFFRDDEKLNELSVDDRIEIFRHILVGSSDFTKSLFEEILSDYGVSTIQQLSVGYHPIRGLYELTW